MKEVQRDTLGKHAGTGTLMGVFAAGRGIGSVACGPLSDVLLKAGQKLSLGCGKSFHGYRSECMVMIVFAGISALGGLIAFGARGVRHVHGPESGDELVAAENDGSGQREV